MVFPSLPKVFLGLLKLLLWIQSSHLTRGSNEVVIDNFNGLVPIGDTKQLEESVLTLLDNIYYEFCKNSEAGRTKIQNEKIANQYKIEYK